MRSHFQVRKRLFIMTCKCMSDKIRCWMFHNAAAWLAPPTRSGRRHAALLHHLTRHNMAGYWTQLCTERLMRFIFVDSYVCFFITLGVKRGPAVNVEATRCQGDGTQPGGGSQSRRTAALVIQEEIVPALLLLRVLEKTRREGNYFWRRFIFISVVCIEASHTLMELSLLILGLKLLGSLLNVISSSDRKRFIPARRLWGLKENHSGLKTTRFKMAASKRSEKNETQKFFIWVYS